jgi:ABC-type nitrate/sulfonate/bicarbonate transport system ATPase subunit
MAVIARAKEAGEIWQRANKAMIADDYAKAVAELSEVLKLLPNDDDSFTEGVYTCTKGDIYQERGNYYGSLEQFEEAFADFDKAISLEPKKGKFYYMRSLLYIKNGEMEKAKADIEKAVELNSVMAGNYYNTFATYIRGNTGDKQTAAVYFKKSVEHGDHHGMSKSQLDEWGIQYTPQPQSGSSSPAPQAPAQPAPQPQQTANAPTPSNIFVEAKYIASKTFNNVSFVVGEKEIVALTASSGDKLSAIIHTIAGLKEITEGEIYIDGELINDLPYIDRNVTIVSKDINTDTGSPSLFNSGAAKKLAEGGLAFKMTAYDNMAYELKYKKVPKSEIERRITEIAKMFEIDNLLNRNVIALSGGQRLRVSVTRAIIRHPKVFLFDNPFEPLDSNLRIKIREQIFGVLRSFNATAIFATTDQAEANAIADRVIAI